MLTRLARRALPRAIATTSATPQCFTQTAHKSTQVVDTGRTYDTLYEDVQIGKDAKAQRAFTYVTLGGARFLYASAGRLAVMKFVATMSASADVLALSSLEVDVNKIDPGTTMTVKWRGKPVFIRNRNEAEIASAMECDTTTLRDIESDEERRKEDPTWCVVVIFICFFILIFLLSNTLFHSLLTNFLFFFPFYRPPSSTFFPHIYFISYFTGLWSWVYAHTLDVYPFLMQVIMVVGSAHAMVHTMIHLDVSEKVQHH